MSSQNNVYVDIIADIKGFNTLAKGEQQVFNLEKSVKKLASTLGIAFGAREIVNFGKESVAAFAADNQSAIILSKTLANLGQAFTDTKVEAFITKLSELNGITKTDLRNSFDTLVRATRSTAKAQDLMNTAINVSKGTGKDLGTVTTALSKAYGGNVTALSKIATGLTKAQLSSKNFAHVQALLNTMFKGDAAAAADTYQGKIDRLKTSWDEFKITIGSGIVDAFSNLGKGSSVEVFQGLMQKSADAIANIIRGIGEVSSQIASVVGSINSLGGGWLGKLFSFSENNSLLGWLFNVGKTSKAKSDAKSLAGTAPMAPYAEGYTTAADHAAYLQSQKDAAAVLAATKAQTAQQVLQNRLEKDKLALTRAASIFDLNKIQIQAALISGAKTLSAGDIQRLDLKKEEADLQDAINAKNADLADKLAEQITNTKMGLLAVSDSITALPKASDPFTAVVSGAQTAIEWIQKAADFTAAYNASQSSSVFNPNPYAVPGYAPTTSTAAPTVQVQVTLDGQVVGNAVANTITQSQVDSSASGVNPYFQRSGYGTAALAW